MRQLEPLAPPLAAVLEVLHQRLEDLAHREQRMRAAPLCLREEERRLRRYRRLVRVRVRVNPNPNPDPNPNPNLRRYRRERAVARDVAVDEEVNLRLHKAPRLAQHLVRGVTGGVRYS